jgi:uncharacterized protein DUF3995
VPGPDRSTSPRRRSAAVPGAQAIAVATAVRSGSRRSRGWAAYAACAWAAAYAIGVRGYQGLGGTVGLPGVLEEPAAVRRASLAAGAAILLAGLACLALVRPWGLRLPRRLIVVTALVGAVVAVTHALIAYVSKPLHLLGVIDLEFKGWIEIDETQAILWDLLFYEPWFLGLGVVVTIAAGHHHRRAGGGEREWRGLVVGAAGVTAVWAAVSCVQLGVG